MSVRFISHSFSWGCHRFISFRGGKTGDLKPMSPALAPPQELVVKPQALSFLPGLPWLRVYLVFHSTWQSILRSFQASFFKILDSFSGGILHRSLTEEPGMPLAVGAPSSLHSIHGARLYSTDQYLHTAAWALLKATTSLFLLK